MAVSIGNITSPRHLQASIQTITPSVMILEVVESPFTEYPSKDQAAIVGFFTHVKHVLLVWVSVVGLLQYLRISSHDILPPLQHLISVLRPVVTSYAGARSTELSRCETIAVQLQALAFLAPTGLVVVTEHVETEGKQNRRGNIKLVVQHYVITNILIMCRFTELAPGMRQPNRIHRKGSFRRTQNTRSQRNEHPPRAEQQQASIMRSPCRTRAFPTSLICGECDKSSRGHLRHFAS